MNVSFITYINNFVDYDTVIINKSNNNFKTSMKG